MPPVTCSALRSMSQNSQPAVSFLPCLRPASPRCGSFGFQNFSAPPSCLACLAPCCCSSRGDCDERRRIIHTPLVIPRESGGPSNRRPADVARPCPQHCAVFTGSSAFADDDDGESGASVMRGLSFDIAHLLAGSL